MGNFSKFQIIVIGIIVFVVLMILLIAGGIVPGSEDEADQPAKLVFWGFDDRAVFNEALGYYRDLHPKIDIQYQKKDLQSFEDELLNAISSGQSPDVIIFPSYDLGKHADKLSAAPPILITQREIQQEYIEAGNVFTTAEKSVLGIPVSADALILFYNKDLFTKSFITLPPTTWDAFLEYSQKLTVKSASGDIVISGSAMGRAKNIKHAPSILTALFLQSGEKIIEETGKIMLGEAKTPSAGSAQIETRPAESALRFFSDFANPRKISYSWSLALPEAFEFFSAGKLGMYFGPLSEYALLQKKNPHLAFSVAPTPDFANASRTTTYGTLFAASVPKASRNQRAAWTFAIFLGSKEGSGLYAKNAGTVSVRRELLPTYTADLVKSVFAKSVFSLSLWPNIFAKRAAARSGP